MKRVAIYARVSTTNGTQDYQRQINDLTPIIMKLGYTKDQIEIFAESISGYKKKAERPELNRMLNLIEQDKAYFECIYCTEISRLGRNPSETRQTIDMLTDLFVPIYIQSLGRATLDKDGKRDSIMNIILQVLLEFANSESEQMKTRSKSGLLTSAKAGKAGGSKNLPYGYAKAEDKMLIIDEEEAIIIRDMFDLYQQGNGVKVISGILNTRNIPTRYNKAYSGQTLKIGVGKDANKIKWSDKTVLDIIANPIYKGQRRFKGEILHAPNIISTELFDSCEQIRTTKTHRNNLTTYTYLLKDIMKCGCCGRNYFAKYKPTLEGDKVYVCSSLLKTGERCANKGINIMLLETAIYNQLVESDTVLKYIGETKNIKKDLEISVTNLEHQLKTEQAQLPLKLAEKKRLLEGWIQGIITDGDAFKDMNEKLISQLSSIEKKITIMNKEIAEKKVLIARQSNTSATKTMLLEAATDRTQLQAIFKQLVSKVIINDLTPKLSLATVYIQINGVVLPNTLKIIIDKYSIRKKELRYVSLRSMENDPVFKNDIMLVDKEDIIFELGHTLYPEHWVKVDTLLEVVPKVDEVEKVA